MKKFYKTASTKADEENSGSWQIYLDDRPIKTPDGNPILIQSKSIADKVVDEWNAQEDQILPATMPIYSILVTATDKSDQDSRDQIFQELSPYFDGDLLFYHAPDPDGLVLVQKSLWGGALEQFEKSYNINPITTYDLVALRQPDEYHKILRDYIQSLSPIEFTIFHLSVSLSGSPLSTLLFMEKAIDKDAFEAIVFAEQDFYQKLYKLEADDVPPEDAITRKTFRQEVEACQILLAEA